MSKAIFENIQDWYGFFELCKIKAQSVNFF